MKHSKLRSGTKLIAAFLFLLTGCYYDNASILYPSSGNCTATATSTFTADVLPILNSRCNNCHGGSYPSGDIKLDTYAAVLPYVNSGSLMGSINQTSGFSPMPKNGSKLSTCQIQKIQNWITSGALNN